MREKTLQTLRESKAVVIVRGQTPENMVRLADALYEGGMALIEVTFQQDKPGTWAETADAIRRIAGRFGGRVLPGAGTVLTREQARIARDAGARYLISPNADPEVIRATREMGLVSLPGAFTPTEIASAHEAGADMVKVFPVSLGGPGLIRALRAPLSHIELIAVGGVTPENAAQYIEAGASGVGTSMIYRQEWIDAGDFCRVTEQAAALARALK